MRGRALFWYRESLPGLTGLMKSKAAMRIKELASEEVASLIRRPASGRPAETTNPDSGESPVQGDYRRWQIKGGDPAFDAELKQVERGMVVLKKKADDQIVKIDFDNLSDGDQEAVSDWTLRELDRIWKLGTARIGPRDSRENVKSKELARGLEGAWIRTAFAIDGRCERSREKAARSWHFPVPGVPGSKKSSCPFPSRLRKISADARLIVIGRLNIKYAACPFCGGTGLAKRPSGAWIGLSYERKPIVFPNGQRGAMQNVQVLVKMSAVQRNRPFRQVPAPRAAGLGTVYSGKVAPRQFFHLHRLGRTRRVCVLLDEPRFQICMLRGT